MVFCAGQGDLKDRGLNHFGHKGLLKRVIGGHLRLIPKIQQLIIDNEVEGYNMSQGIISQLFRDIAAKRPGHLTHVGLNTFDDPRLGGGKCNQRTTEDLIELISLHGKEYLLYKSFPVHFALLRGTTADENGNISNENEALSVEVLQIAQAVYNSGGKVFVQVERIVPAGSIDPKHVKIPGLYVDSLVVTQRPENHMQTFLRQFNPAYCSRPEADAASIPLLPFSERKVVCRRAALELKANTVVNLGIGMSEGVSSIAYEEGLFDGICLTVESGPIGGVPAGGLDFGCSSFPQAIIWQPEQFDFYQGGGIDEAFLGMAQVDEAGNVNVSKFGSKLAGCGGFIDITQNAKEVVFCGTFTAGGLQIDFSDGKVTILKEGKNKKFVRQVEQITFAAKNALTNAQPVLFVTERAVFRLLPEGLTLTEIAPGIVPERDIFPQMDFLPRISPSLKTMDAQLFRPEKMGVSFSQNGNIINENRV